MTLHAQHLQNCNWLGIFAVIGLSFFLLSYFAF
jgi:hypothetical protein